MSKIDKRRYAGTQTKLYFRNLQRRDVAKYEGFFFLFTTIENTNYTLKCVFNSHGVRDGFYDYTGF